MQTIIEELKSFNSAVEFQKGHTHLYVWFDRIVDRLKNTELSDLEKEAVCATRQILLYEISRSSLQQQTVHQSLCLDVDKKSIFQKLSFLHNDLQAAVGK